MIRLVLLCLVVAGCGQKGPLYFAEQPPEAPASTTSQPPAADDNEQTQED